MQLILVPPLVGGGFGRGSFSNGPSCRAKPPGYSPTPADGILAASKVDPLPALPHNTRGGTANRCRVGDRSGTPSGTLSPHGGGTVFLLAGRGGFGFGLAWCGAAMAHPDGYPHQGD